VTDTERKLDDQAATTPVELDEADLDQAAGGLQDIHVTKPIDKPSQTLGIGSQSTGAGAGKIPFNPF
jgi:hypothetical protein